MSTYIGGAFHSSLPKGRSSGTLEISGELIRFATASHRAEMPLEGLRFQIGGASNRLVFMTHEALPGWKFHTGDPSFLKNPDLLRISSLASQIGALNKAKIVRIALAAGVILVFLQFLACLWFLKDPVVEVVAEKIPTSWEITMGETVFKHLSGSRTLIADPLIQENLQRLTAPLLESIPDKRYPFQIHLAADAESNAFALPGGTIVINSALLLEAATPEEVLGVLAHEIAHVTQRHSLRQLIGSTGLFLIVQAFLGDASGLLAVLADNGTLLFTQKFSRDFEREADLKGWDYLVSAQINPQGMINFFQKMQEKSEKSGFHQVEQLVGFASTHPATAERLDRLRTKSLALDPNLHWIKIPVDFQKLQQQIKSVHGKKE